MEDVDNSVSRILHIKYALGLFVGSISNSVMKNTNRRQS